MPRKMPDIRSQTDDPTASALREVAEVLGGIQTKLDALEKSGGGGGSGRGKHWTDAAMRVLIAVLTALVIGTGTFLLQLNKTVGAQTEIMIRLDRQTIDNKAEVKELERRYNTHVENGG